MTKSELIEIIAEKNPHLQLQDVERVVAIIFEEISDALVRGDKVAMRGFGTFLVKERKPRTGRNPRTGDSVEVPLKRVPFLKTGKKIHQLLNSDYQ